MLGLDSQYTVYTVCGKIHDPKCCGWLFHSDDNTARSHVRGLFLRTIDPLQIAFVTPQYLSADGSLHFVREETANLVRLLIEFAPQAVILSPAPRVYEDKEALPGRRDVTYYSVDVSKTNRSGRTFEYIFGGRFEQFNCSPEEKLERLRDSLGAACHYQDKQTDAWTVMPTKA